jgi:hypothetical protein
VELSKRPWNLLVKGDKAMKMFNSSVKIGLAVILVFAILSEGCAPTKPYEYMEYPDGGRIYRARNGDTLRVDSEGKVYGYPGNKRFGSGEHGTAQKIGDDWDMSPFDVGAAVDAKTEHAGKCEILFPVFWSDKAVKERYVSCWNRMWEIPAFVVAVPIMLVAAAFIVTVEGIGAAVSAIKK